MSTFKISVRRITVSQNITIIWNGAAASTAWISVEWCQLLNVFPVPMEILEQTWEWPLKMKVKEVADKPVYSWRGSEHSCQKVFLWARGNSSGCRQFPQPFRGFSAKLIKDKDDNRSALGPCLQSGVEVAYKAAWWNQLKERFWQFLVGLYRC